ncbi:MAG: hypothetical protein MAGBODY4_01451 [Candidatus Marinimicrobia bacterium]|nr:hypothetical protein [Candidatus Neomarinimicrobiota bacterium]
MTLAHELFHHFHLGYVLDTGNIWWYELTSSWFEDVAYPEVNDYAQYVSRFFHNPRTLDQSGGYQAAHYGFVLSDYGEPQLWNEMWTAFIDSSAYFAIESTLEEYGTSFSQSYQRFAGWNLLTGERALPGVGYPDAGLYPEIEVDGQITIPDSLPTNKAIGPRDIGYYEVFNGNEPQFYQMDFSGDGAFLKGVFALSDDTEILREFDAGQSLGIDLNHPDYTGLVALANGGEQFKALKIDQIVKILRPYPNPFVRGEHSVLKLYTVLTEKSAITLHMYNIRGQKMYTYNFGHTEFESGPQTLTIPLDAATLGTLSSGVYFLRLEAGNSRQSTKFVLIQ